MRRFLRRIPRGLNISVTAISGGLLLVVGALLPAATGSALVILAVVGVLALLASVVTNLAREYQSEHAARLRVELEVQPWPLEIPSYVDADGALQDWLDAERHRRRRPSRSTAAKPRRIDLDAVRKEREEAGQTESISFGELEELERRDAAGEELTDDERATLVAATGQLKDAMAGIRAMTSAFSEPDPRTPEQYDEQLDAYLTDCEQHLQESVLWQFVERGLGRLQLILVNPTDKVFEDVQLEIYFRGEIRAVWPDDLDEPDDSLPTPPRPFGQRIKRLDFGAGIYPHAFADIARAPVAPISSVHRGGPTIDNSASAKVTWEPVMLRPRATVPLDEIALLIGEGEEVRAEWRATATNAEGLVENSFTFAAAGTILVADMLNAVLAPDDE